MTHEKLAKWKKKRLTTFFVFCCEYLADGMTFMMFTTASWSYITKQLKPKNSYLVYSIMLYLNYLPTLLFGLVATNLHDKYKDTKKFMRKQNKKKGFQQNNSLYRFSQKNMVFVCG